MNCSTKDCNHSGKYTGLCRKHHPLRTRYYSMKARVLSKNHSMYKYYGGRGITITGRWLGKDGFANFIYDMGLPPTKKHTLDRIDNEKGYAPENCRWATQSQQQINTRIYKSNKSGYKGVSWDSHAKKWRATLKHNGKKVHLGLYRDSVSAAIAFNDAATKYRGVDVWLNDIPIDIN